MKMSRAMGAVAMAESDMVADMGDAAVLTGAVREHKEVITVEEAAAEAMPEADSEGGAARENAPAFTYRDSNVPLAFFRPSLVTDSEGRLELKFTLPDANTTWDSARSRLPTHSSRPISHAMSWPPRILWCSLIFPASCARAMSL